MSPKIGGVGRLWFLKTSSARTETRGSCRGALTRWTSNQESGAATVKKGDVVTSTVTGITDGGIEVEMAGGFPGFIRKSELSRDRAEQRPDRFAVGEKLDAKITMFDRATRKATLSIKAKEIDEEKEAMAEFGSSDSGASLGDILGAALRGREKEDK